MNAAVVAAAIETVTDGDALVNVSAVVVVPSAATALPSNVHDVIVEPVNVITSEKSSPAFRL